MRQRAPFLKGLIWLLAIPVFFSCWNDITEVYVRSISVSPTSMTLREGESSFITHTISPSNASIKSVKWSCSDTSVVKVSDGNVQAVGRGAAVVTVVTLDGSGLSADCNVKVIRATDAVVFGEGVDPDHVFGPEGGEFSISFKAEEDWSLDVINTRADNWLSFSPSSGKAGEAEVKVTVPENTGYEERFAELRLCCDKEEYPFTVTQKQKDALTVTSGRYEVEAGGGSVTVTVTANVEFGYTVSDSWIKAVSTKALESHTLEFTISPNEDVNVREGHIVIEGAGLSETVTVYQHGTEPALAISGKEYVIGSEGGVLAVEITSNVDVAVEIPSEIDWLRETASQSTGRVCIEVDANPLLDDRSAQVSIVSPEYGLSETLTILQKKHAELDVDTSGITVPQDGGSFEVTLESNVQYAVSVSDPWIQEVSTKGLSEYSHSFVAEALPKDVFERSAQIVFSTEDGALERSISVFQKDESEIITFADPAVKAICVGEWDRNGDGELSIREAAVITGLGTLFNNNQDITSFDELRFFTGLSGIDDYAFYNCPSLKSVTLPAQISKIGEYAFCGCESLLEVIIPDTVQIISKGAFYQCTSLGSIIIPAGVLQIGSYAFYRCLGLKSIFVLAQQPPSLGESALTGTDACWIFVPDESVSAYKEDDSWKAVADRIASKAVVDASPSIEFKDALVKEICVQNWDRDKDGELSELEASLVSSFRGVFQNNGEIVSFDELRYFTGLEAIDNWTFSHCTSLQSVTLPPQISLVGEGAFYECSSLVGIVIPEHVVSLGQYAFYLCSGLKNVDILPETVPDIGERCFDHTNDCWLFVPGTSVAAYKGDERWSVYSDRIIDRKTAESSPVISFKDNAVKALCVSNWDRDNDGELSELEASLVISLGQIFCNNKEIASFDELSYFSGLESINSWDFGYCTSLKSVALPGQLSVIGEYAFSCCESLEMITIPESVSSLGAYAFGWCYGLKSIELLTLRPPVAGEGVFANSICWIFVPDASVTEYSGDEGWAVYSDRIIDRKTVESSPLISFKDGAVKGICVEKWDRSFDGELSELEASRIKSIRGCFSGHEEIVCFDELRFFTGLEAIDNRVFSYCKSLKSIMLPGQISAIGEYAFYDCESLEGIVLPESIASLGANAFGWCRNLKSIDILSGQVPQAGENLFYNSGKCWIFVPCASVTDYRSDERWREYSDRIIDRETAESSPLIIFKDDAVKSICVEHWDRSFDGELSELEASRCRSISGCFSWNDEIISFDELRYFTGIESIDEYSFYGCRSLVAIVVPENVTSIGVNAFAWCDGLKSIELLPRSVPETGSDAFIYTGICWIYVPEGCVSDYRENEGWRPYLERIVTRKENDSSPVIQFEDAVAKDLCVHSFDRSFDGELSQLEASSIKSLGYIFQSDNQISSFEEFRFFTGLESLGAYSFSGCKSLASIVIPESVKSIGRYAFYWSQALQSIDFLSSEPPEIAENCFAGIGASFFIYVPESSIKAYKEAVCWNDYSGRITCRGHQPSEYFYKSVDYSKDKTCVQLQAATVGRGLNLVFMGDGFTDRDLQGGTYEEMARGYMEQIFVYEPFKSFRNRFNVWLVYAVSENSEFFNPDSRRAFSSDHEDGSISLAWDATNGYKEAVPNPYNLPLKMSLFFNCDQSLGRSYSGVNINSNTLAVIFDPLEYRPTVINHELGHGFAALADEYEEHEGAYPNPEGLDNDYNIFGWWANVDWRNDPATVRWSHLLADSRYSEEGLGIFEGAKLYPQGIYRPTFNSMMRFDFSKGAVYNAPCREQIYKVIMSLSEGEGWEYDYETFVKDDEAGRKQAADAYSGVAFPSRNAPGRRADKDDFKPGLPPILLNDNVRSVRVYPDGKVKLEY